jgi:malate permease and related proteins
MNFNNILNQVIILFFIMIVGFVARKKNIINSEVNKGLSEILLNITLPFMIIASFNFSFDKNMLHNSAVLFIYSLLMHGALVIISKIIYYKYPNVKKGVLRFITVFSNCGYMGYPVIESVFGKIGVFYTAIFNIPWNLLVYSVGIMFFSREKDSSSIKKAVMNPGIISVFIGLILFVFSIKLPLPIYNTLEMVGSTTTPLSMIIVGSMLAEMKLKDVFSGFEIYYGCVVRLVLIPVVVLVILKSFGVKDIFLGIPVLIAAMPAAANTAIFAEKYGGDSLLASRMIFISTALSAITIPLIILMI